MSENKLPRKYEILQPLLLSLMVVLGIFMGRRIEQSSTPEAKIITRPKDGTKNNAAILDEAIRFIEARHIDSLSIRDLNEEALVSLTQQLDPFSNYIPANRLQDDTLKSFEDAYGFRASLKNKKFIVEHIVPNSSAWKSSLEIGDEIIRLEKSAPQLKNFSSWPYPLLHLDIQKNNLKAPISIGLTRQDSIKSTTVGPALPLDRQIGYIQIRHFGDNTYDEFITALDSLTTKYHSKHLIIDLRNNPGGYLEECIRILNQLFKEKNLLLVSTEGRTIRKTEYKSDGRQLFDLEKIAILINGKSASASEVFAGAVQDLERGKIIGQPSYGKGLVQEQYMLSNGGALRISVSRYGLPSGRTIDISGKSLDPAKVFKTKSGKLIRPTKVIVPDILIEENKPDLSILNEEVSSKIKAQCVALKDKYKPDDITKPSLAIERKIIQALSIRWNRMNTAQKQLIQAEILQSWYMVNKKYDPWLKSVLLHQPEMISAMRIM
jgi:carboxyl-terminal processing protease